MSPVSFASLVTVALYGLIGARRFNGIDSEAYLRHILSVLPEWPCNKVTEPLL
ncbi:hypothetical protein GJM11_26505 [Salmonella enterica]|nr:hypothetical protein [Salmonella enterica]EEF7432608.1 hypothetical protein [Salmonella enterica subsp. enterica serovar Java]EEL6612014.1 hypothetical protein [Salmonella enterica]EEM3073540.1 hypothetical protein [Salmonella enterica subsp. enterica serovar Java]